MTRTFTVTHGNNWGGRLPDALLEHVSKQAAVSDFMFFSEVDHAPHVDQDTPLLIYTNEADKNGNLYPIMVNQYDVLQGRFSNKFWSGFSAENRNKHKCAVTDKRVKVVEYGNAYFASRMLNVLHMDAQLIFDSRKDGKRSHITPRSLESIVIEHEGKRTVLAHFHGVWIKGNTKGDCPERDEQSQNVLEALERLARQYDTDRVIVGGDFNLDINTGALAALEAGLPGGKLKFRNLIREYGITDTRTPHYRHYDHEGSSKYADYVLVTDTVIVESFGLRGKDASDHAHPQTTFS